MAHTYAHTRAQPPGWACCGEGPGSEKWPFSQALFLMLRASETKGPGPGEYGGAQRILQNHPEGQPGTNRATRVNTGQRKEKQPRGLQIRGWEQTQLRCALGPKSCSRAGPHPASSHLPAQSWVFLFIASGYGGLPASQGSLKGTAGAVFPVSPGAGATDHWQVTEEKKQDQLPDCKMSQLKGTFDAILSSAPCPGPAHPRLFILSRNTGWGPSL